MTSEFTYSRNTNFTMIIRMTLVMKMNRYFSSFLSNRLQSLPRLSWRWLPAARVAMPVLRFCAASLHRRCRSSKSCLPRRSSGAPVRRGATILPEVWSPLPRGLDDAPTISTRRHDFLRSPWTTSTGRRPHPWSRFFGESTGPTRVSCPDFHQRRLCCSSPEVWLALFFCRCRSLLFDFVEEASRLRALICFFSTHKVQQSTVYMLFVRVLIHSNQLTWVIYLSRSNG
jgi:hypothetical protein